MSRASLLLVALAALSPGCIHLQRTDRLDEARAAYEKAQQGPAAESSPADLATAKKFLELAEKGLDTGDPKVVDDRATVAILKIQSAEALGRTHELAAERDHTLQAVTATRQTLLDQTQQKLAVTRAELEREKAGRDAAESRTSQTRAVLAQEALIRDLPEGTVISLPGGQLFHQGHAELLPAGRDRLTQVADVLKTSERSARVQAQPPTKGPRKSAVALSSKRAERVRDFLVGEGVTAGQITADSPTKKPTRPLPNTPEFATGGAVDIVLEPASASTGAPRQR
jgi:outer membrane protein OmpA-like peptidoglycan-associated protein